MGKQRLREPLSIGTTSRTDVLRKDKGIRLIGSWDDVECGHGALSSEDDHKVATEMTAMTIACALFME